MIKSNENIIQPKFCLNFYIGLSNTVLISKLSFTIQYGVKMVPLARNKLFVIMLSNLQGLAIEFNAKPRP